MTLAVTECGLQRWVPGADRFMDDELGLFEEMGVNWALWEWTSAFRIAKCPTNDAFSQLSGPDPNNHRETPNRLFATVLTYWRKNGALPRH